MDGVFSISGVLVVHKGKPVFHIDIPNVSVLSEEVLEVALAHIAVKFAHINS